jgi:two-component system, NarL family, response regulator NreC
MVKLRSPGGTDMLASDRAKRVPTVVLVDDHAILRSGLRTLIASRQEFEVVGEADGAQEAVALATQLRPDLIVLDISLGNDSGLSVIARLRSFSPTSRILVLSMHDEPAYLKTAISNGASGYLLKRSADQELFAALAAVHAGRTYVDPTMIQHLVGKPAESFGQRRDEILTAREREVLVLCARGFGLQRIASRLTISPKTVEAHRTRLSKKLGLRDRAELLRYAFEAGLVTVDEILRVD